MVGIDTEPKLCSVSNCAGHAVESERAETAIWVITVRYCDEHWRGLNKGVPLGPVGLDVTRLEVESKGAREPMVPAVHGIGPQG